jgi:hypothetical protein
MESHRQSHPPYGVAIGLATGMMVGAGLAIWLAPRLASELGERITGSAKSIGQRASNHCARASNRFGEAVEALTSPRAL